MPVPDLIEPSPDERLDDLAVIAAVMPELAVALQTQAEISARLVARLRASVAEGDRQMAELGLAPD